MEDGKRKRLAAVQAVGTSSTDPLTELLDGTHRTESAAEMMKAD